MFTLNRQYQYYLYNSSNELVYRTNSFDDAVIYKQNHNDISINAYRR